jgi:hypothetical protein
MGLTRVGGIDYPVDAGGQRIFNRDTTPMIVHGAQVKMEQQADLRAQRVEIAQLVNTFAALIGASVGVLAGYTNFGGSRRPLTSGVVRRGPARSSQIAPDMVYRAPRPAPYEGPPNPRAAQTPGEHLQGGDHLPGSRFESWTSDRSVAERFAKSRGTTVIELDLSTARGRVAADLRTAAGREAAALAEEHPWLAGLIRASRDDMEVILRRSSW